MAKTYSLEALWPLLEFRKPKPPLLAIAESGSVSYVANADGIWLVADLEGLTDQEMQAVTGLHPANLGSKKIEGIDGYAYGMQGGKPLLPLPFTAADLRAFEERTPEVISEHINRGNDTDAWIAYLEKENPDAAELAMGIYHGQWFSDLADLDKAMPVQVASQSFKSETKDERQKRRYDLCVTAGLKMPNDNYAHLPTGIGAIARAEHISTAAFSKDVKAYIASRHK